MKSATPVTTVQILATEEPLSPDNTVAAEKLRPLIIPAFTSRLWRTFLEESFQRLTTAAGPLLVTDDGELRLSQSLALHYAKSYSSFEASMAAAILYNGGEPLHTALEVDRKLDRLTSIRTKDGLISAHGLHQFLRTKEPIGFWIHRCRLEVECVEVAGVKMTTRFTENGARQVAMATRGPLRKIIARYYADLVPREKSLEFFAKVLPGFPLTHRKGNPFSQKA